jgi:aminopeptidase N
MRWSILLIAIFILNHLGAQISESDSIWNKGVKLMEEGDFLGGLEKMNDLLDMIPFSPSALYNRGICLQNLGDIQGSCNDFRKAQDFGLNFNGKIIDIFCDDETKLERLEKQYYKNIKLYQDLGYRPVYTTADTLRGALRLERTCYDVFFYNLTVKILPAKKRIIGKNEIWFKGVQKSKVIQVDLFDNFIIHKISADNRELKYKRKYQALFIEMPDTIQPGNNYIITIEYSGKPIIAPNPPWDGGFVWSRDKRLNRWDGVACEYLGASSWWPNKDHLSEKPDSMSINIEVPKRFKAVSNGKLRKVVSAGKRYLRYEWFVDYPINNYNATFYMGKYKEYTDTLNWQGKNLVMRYDVMPYHLEKAKVHFAQARDVVSFYNDAFGPFPFWNDNYRMVESPFEGMEHQTAIAYGESFDNKKNAMTYVSKKFDYIIVHETAHEWWGNAVAAGDMADIWIQEGFATYSEILFLEHMLGYDKSMLEVYNHMQYIYNVWPLVQNRNVNENSFASNDVYTKGAILLQCLRCAINNDSLFLQMLHDFNMEFRYKVVSTSDFINYVNKYTSQDYSAFFDKYLYETDLPVLEYTYEKKDSVMVIKYQWTGVKDGFKMPFSIESFGDKKSYRIEATTTVQEMVLEKCRSIAFFNLMKLPENCPHNGLTYYWTHCGNSR